MKYLKLYQTFCRINFMKDMAYRGNFLFGLVTTSIESFTVWIGSRFIFNHVTNIAGWTYQDMLVLLGTFMIASGTAWLLFRGGVADLDRTIGKGDLDWYLIKPVDTQFFVSIQRIDFEDAARSAVGFVLLAAGLAGRETFTVLKALPLFLILFFAGQIIYYSIQISLKSISFKSIQGWATNSIAFRFQELAQYPTDIYKGLIRVIYTFVLPLVFIVTVPAKALTGRLTVELFLGSLLAAAGALTVARLIWKRALRTYSSASS